MRKWLQKLKKRTTVDDGSLDDSGSRPRGADDTRITRSFSSAGLLDGPKGYQPSYQELPVIPVWKAPPRTNKPLPSPSTFDTSKPLPKIRHESLPGPTTTPFPFPTELMFLLIDNYLSQELQTLLNLGRALPALRHQCWTHAFRSVKIFIRQREIERKMTSSNVDLFLQLLSRTPEIYPYICELDVEDRGRLVWHHRGLLSSSQEDLTTLSLLLVQTQRMTKLKSFRITSSIVWTNLPIHVKEAFFAMFNSPTLSEISLSGILLPVNLLALVKNLQVVDFQTGGVGPPKFHQSVAYARPKQVDALKIRDRNPFSNPMSVLGFSDHSFKPFSLAHLKSLEICLPGKSLETVQDGLKLCQSLEVFKIFVGTAGGLPHPLILDCLPSLKSLTLAADITNILDSAIRFDWVVNLLESIPATSSLQEVILLIRTPSLEQGKQCEWGVLDALFEPPSKPKLLNTPVRDDLTEEEPHAQWPSLGLFKIVWCTARSQDVHENRNEDFLAHLPIFMPHLDKRGVLKMQTTYSDTQYNFWTYT
ncbi:hypothetical protein DFP72DRAFT_1046838 [Ephemerocybe angulata]|uniref:Uncharacterized protein n=1 Tax=Ephemerocybe angulata TaxID=980116 RepID=A0A8H6HUC8_9AGAR|nr:hypothetical protein DFP72DRAFT_1046838 [Tulosesus angulatus]